MINLLCIFLFLLPWSRVPFTATSFPLPLATFFAVISLLPIFIFNLSRYIMKPSITKLPFLFFIYCLASVCVGYFNLARLDKLDLVLYRSEYISYLEIGLKKILQIFYSISAFYVFSEIKSKHLSKLIFWWKIGFLVALIVHAYLFFANTEELLPRAGTFEEGNFAGLYYILTFNLACFFENKNLKNIIFYIVLCGVGVLLSESTIGVFVFAVNVSLILFKEASAPRRIHIVSVFFGVLVLLFVFDINHFYDKIFADSLSVYNFSKYDRISSFYAGVEILRQYPLLGLGVEAYGFLANDYLDQSQLKFYDFSFRRIPNNVYIEVFSEFGVIGSFIFWIFIIKALKRLNRSSIILAAGVVTILLYWIAFPTFSVAYIWVYLGVCFSLAGGLGENRVSKVRSIK